MFAEGLSKQKIDPYLFLLLVYFGDIFIILASSVELTTISASERKTSLCSVNVNLAINCTLDV